MAQGIIQAVEDAGDRLKITIDGNKMSAFKDKLGNSAALAIPGTNVNYATRVSGQYTNIVKLEPANGSSGQTDSQPPMTRSRANADSQYNAAAGDVRKFVSNVMGELAHAGKLEQAEVSTWVEALSRAAMTYFPGIPASKRPKPQVVEPPQSEPPPPADDGQPFDDDIPF